MILIDRPWVPDIKLDLYIFFKLSFHKEILVQSFQRGKLLLLHLANA